MADSELKVQLLLTGNEIMSGDTVDSNSALIAQRLGEVGIGVYRKVTVGDDVALLQTELAAMVATADLVIVNGGLGPTIDDLTAEILAATAGVSLQEHPQAVAHLQQWCNKRNLELNAANFKQAMLPAGASIVDNPVGSAVGFEMVLGDCRVICTPGVPSELIAMMGDIVDTLAARLQRPPGRNILRLQTFGLGESTRRRTTNGNQAHYPQRRGHRCATAMPKDAGAVIRRSHYWRGRCHATAECSAIATPTRCQPDHCRVLYRRPDRLHVDPYSWVIR